MMTIRDICEACISITEIDVTARRDDLSYIHRWIYGQGIDTPPKWLQEMEEGRLTITECKLNYHGDRKKNGQTEGGWGVKTELLPQEILDAPVRTMHLSPRGCWDGEALRVDVEMHDLTAAKLIPVEEVY